MARLMLGVTIDQKNGERKKALDACFALIEASVPLEGARISITIEVPQQRLNLLDIPAFSWKRDKKK